MIRTYLLYNLNLILVLQLLYLGIFYIMKKLYIYIAVLLVVIMMSCKEEQVIKPLVLDENNAIKVDVTHSAGDKWEDVDNFLPLPFNIAKGGEDEIIVMGKRIGDGESVDVKPIGAIRIVENDTLKTYVITVPVAVEHISISTVDFDEFSTVFSGAKWIIEQYLLNRQNSYAVRLKSWENESFAIKYLLK